MHTHPHTQIHTLSLMMIYIGVSGSVHSHRANQARFLSDSELSQQVNSKHYSQVLASVEYQSPQNSHEFSRDWARSVFLFCLFSNFLTHNSYLTYIHYRAYIHNILLFTAIH